MDENHILEFLDTYKKLDELCRQLFLSDKGVSQYIDEMSSEGYGKWRVAGWERDYKRFGTVWFMIEIHLRVILSMKKILNGCGHFISGLWNAQILFLYYVKRKEGVRRQRNVQKAVLRQIQHFHLKMEVLRTEI